MFPFRSHRQWAAFGRTAQSAGVKHVSHRFHHGKIIGGEESIHKADFLNPNPMFTCNAAAEVNAGIQDLFAGLHDTFDLFGITFIEQQNRMNVAVTGVKHVDDSQLIATADIDDGLQDLR